MTQSTTHNIGIKMCQIVTDETIANDLSITVHEKQPLTPSIVSQTIANACTAYIFGQLNKTTVR